MLYKILFKIDTSFFCQTDLYILANSLLNAKLEYYNWLLVMNPETLRYKILTILIILTKEYKHVLFCQNESTSICKDRNNSKYDIIENLWDSC
jgi:hypothetical protein